MSAADAMDEAIDVLVALKQERGVDGDWLYEVDPNATWPDDPRVPLVQGGPDVMLHRTIDAQLDFLRYARAVAGAQIKGSFATTIIEFGEEFARAILGVSS